MMEGPLFWSFVLLAIGLLLLVVEFFVPSGGLLAIACALSLLASIVIGFLVSLTWGMIMMLLVAVIVPIALAITIRWWPHTSMGRSIMNRHPGDVPPDVLPDDEHHRKLRSLPGRVGEAINDMLPNGFVRIDGEKLDAVSIGGVIDAGQRIEVVRVEAGKVHVRATSRRPEPLPESNDQMESPLEQSIEDLGIEGLDDPLA
ncbi:MAG: NfeD family protein [Pirellulaceae bacterium]